MKIRFFSLGFIALIIAGLDRLTKIIISHNIPLYGHIKVIDGFFSLVHIHNRGIAFGLLNKPGHDMIFNILTFCTLIAIGLLLIWYIRFTEKDWKTTIAFGLILGGAVGNLIDRLFLKKVVDFLHFYIGSHAWPAFNLADSAITVGTCLLAYILFFSKENTKEQHPGK